MYFKILIVLVSDVIFTFKLDDTTHWNGMPHHIFGAMWY